MARHVLAGGTALALILIGVGRAGEAKGQTPEGAAAGVIVSGGGGGQGTVNVDIRSLTISEYWLGVEGRPVDPALRAHLGLAEGEGLLVGSVVPDSPAAKAGLREHDVLLKAADKPLAKVQDLIQAVDTTKDKKLSLELIRGGKKRTVEVQPDKRPEGSKGLGFQWPDDKDARAVQRWMERMLSGEEGRWPMRFQFVHPGTILPPGASAQPPLPDAMSVVVTRPGSDPAKIVVEQGDKRWERTEKELDKLPADVRPHVERMLGPTAPGWSGPWPQSKVTVTPSPSVENRLEKRFEDIHRRMDQMQKAIEDLRAHRPRKSPPTDKP